MMIPINFLPPLPVEPLKKSVRRARWRKSYQLAFGLVALIGGVCGAWFMPYPKPPIKSPTLTSGYHGYSGGTTRFRDLEIKDGSKVALYPDAEYKMLSPEEFKRKIHISDGNTSIGDASSDTVTINGNLRVNGTITTDSKTSKCQN